MGIRMRHPEITTYGDAFASSGGYPEALDEEQAAVWEARGWVRVADDETDFRALTVPQLRKLVEEAGLDPASNKKDDLVAALEEARAEGRAETPELIQGP